MTKLICPNCNRAGTSSKIVPVGAKVKCPGCGNSFRYNHTGSPGEVAQPAPVEPSRSASHVSSIASAPSVIASVAPSLAVTPIQATLQPVIQVAPHERQRTNLVGMAALVLGILAFLVAWKPSFGLTIPFGLLGGILGATGLVHGLITKKCRILAAAVGLGLSLAAIIGSVMEAQATAQAEAMARTKQSVEKFNKFSESTRGIAAREGQIPTSEFALEILKECEASEILMPEEYVAAKEAFLDYGGQYVSPTDQPGTRRIERSTLIAIFPKMMAYAKMTKLSSRVVARFIAEMIKQMPKGSSADDYKNVFAKVVITAVKQTGSAERFLTQLTPFLAEQVGEGMPFGAGQEGILSASVFLMVMDSEHPGESYDLGSAAIRTFTYLHRSGREGELGITDDMNPRQKVQAINEVFKKSGVKRLSDFLAPYTEGIKE